MSIKDNLLFIKDKISQTESKTGRKEGSVQLMAVSKFHPQESVLSAIECGQYLFGENRVQEASEKFPLVKDKFPQTCLHMIGSLQSNKVAKAVQIADCIESVDRLSLMEEMEKQCSKISKTLKILFELHTGEESKSGFENKEDLYQALEKCANGDFPHLIPNGFMTMAPFTKDEKLIHKSFITLRETSLELQKQFTQFDMPELSMGMSGDFEIAIEEGSTIVRIGTAIFGERDYSK